ncbi:S8 family peptidase [Fodinicola acaciae]|uniref:S8 family peptidase n=1 Tax=Fodinicola acaciae TaxID=2681555 RepID=UPI001C9E5E26|nr:S8 family peptidase [Fodinicola acaciae]
MVGTRLLPNKTLRRVFAGVSAGVLVAALAVTLPGSSAVAAEGTTGTYIVQMADLPATAYAGTVPGYKATKPADGGKFDAKSADVGKYRAYLRSQHDSLIRQTGGISKIYDYSASFNGFSARMTSAKALQLTKTAGVLSVSKNELRYADTVSTPSFLGIDKPGGLWSKLGGPANAGGGDNLVIGDLDSGIWPENASFKPLPNAKKPHGFHGACVAGEQWTAQTCNSKIVGARYYNAGIGGNDAIHKAPYVDEVASARDINGHGSHTASTAAGNYNTDMVVNGNSLGKGSGMAPAARIAVYKVLWHTGSSASGSTADIAQGIEDAISDGVDVINFSISGSTASSVDPVEIAFLYAADAGIFVSASAGNNGPDASTVAHNSPWLTTVAAGTHDRQFEAKVTLGNGAGYTGAGIGAAVASSPLILASGAARAGADPNGVRLCFSKTWDPAHPDGFLDPAKVAGKIVVCDRGVSDRVDKSKAVQEAGGVGVVLANTSPNSLNADLHTLPTVHLSDTDGAAVKAYANGNANATASLSAGTKVVGAAAPQVAAFSSRGPALSGEGDLLKPDIMAPGVDVLAAVSPVSHHRDYDFESGTSMAAPHITGLATLIRQLHPKWSPMMVKSALMTTASTVDNKGNPIPDAGPFDYGSGEVTPNSAADPGLVYDSKLRDWVRYLCGVRQLDAKSMTCRVFGSIDPSDLNQPNIAIGDLPGIQTVTRTVTNVGTTTTRYFASVSAPAGVTVTVSPTTLRLRPGQSASYKVTFTRTTAAYGTYANGSLTWSDGTHNVRSVLAVRPVGVRSPSTINGTGTSGSAKVSPVPAYDGKLVTSVTGLVAGDERPATLKEPSGAAFPSGAPVAGPHTAKFTVTVPAGTKLARFATFDADVAAGTDLDMFVYKAGTADLVGTSSSATAQEQVDLVDPAAGSYDVYLDLFALGSGKTEQPIKEFDWSLGSTAAGNLTATPASQAARFGKAATVTAAWSGLSAGKRYLGQMSFGDGTSTLGASLVRINA